MQKYVRHMIMIKLRIWQQNSPFLLKHILIEVMQKNLKNNTCSWKLFGNNWEEEIPGAKQQLKQYNKWILAIVVHQWLWTS